MYVKWLWVVVVVEVMVVCLCVRACVHVHVCIHVYMCMYWFTCVCAWDKGTTKKKREKGKLTWKNVPTLELNP